MFTEPHASLAVSLAIDFGVNNKTFNKFKHMRVSFHTPTPTPTAFHRQHIMHCVCVCCHSGVRDRSI